MFKWVNGGKVEPAYSRFFIEINLVEEFNWTFDQIRKTAYKDIQRLLLFRHNRQEAVRLKSEVDLILKNNKRT